ncbi:MAG: ribosomal protein S18 acetylase RimI-like enzyme [Chlamydiales bacterium]|jgi:ribosomal protein S18 acetylase RimI-like enzyme
MSETPNKIEDPRSEPCLRLAWDSEFFGLSVARVQASALQLQSARAVRDWAVAEAVECVYFLNEPITQASVSAALEVGFREIDVRVELELTLEQGAPAESTPSPDIGPAQDQERAAVASMARGLHLDSRFFEDPNIRDERARELYARWVQNAFRTPADEVLVARVDGRPAGYVACQMEADEQGPIGRIGLIGVSPQAQGAGLGNALIQSSIEWFRSHGAGRVRVVTQGRNEGALRLYTRAGFSPYKRSAWLHLWALRPTD